jgi:hypothetical protein
LRKIANVYSTVVDLVIELIVAVRIILVDRSYNCWPSVSYSVMSLDIVDSRSRRMVTVYLDWTELGVASRRD